MNIDQTIEKLKEIYNYFRECRSNASFGSKAENHFFELQEAASDAIELIQYQDKHTEAFLKDTKSREPRVLTLEEVKHFQSQRDGAVWLEALSGLFPALQENTTPNTTYFVAIPLKGHHGYVDNKWYGKTWRCWSAKPTPEQRKAVKWDD